MQWDIQFVSLAAVAEVDGASIVRSSLPGFVAEISSCDFFEGGEFHIDFRVRIFHDSLAKGLCGNSL